ncbi:MAG TPA: GDSL-type esterase/lipase family protein [Candidatus Saccharimonadales bacterium]
MKRILCYGDSNTRGSIGNGRRMDDEKQWPNILQALLGDRYRAVQEGLGGRVAGELDDRSYLNGRTSFEVIYRSAAPVDLVVTALGTNDLKMRYRRTAQALADDLLWYAQAVEKLRDVEGGRMSRILYIAPENHPQAEPGVWAGLIEIMRQFDAPVLELGKLGKGPDGLHFSEPAHAQVAHTLEGKIKEMQL